MNLFAVSFFGHREVDDPFVIEQQLEAIVRELLHSKEYVEFLVSSNNFLRPDSSPFYCFFRNGRNGSRLACLGNRRSYSKIKPPIFQIYP